MNASYDKVITDFLEVLENLGGQAPDCSLFDPSREATRLTNIEKREKKKKQQVMLLFFSFLVIFHASSSNGYLVDEDWFDDWETAGV